MLRQGFKQVLAAANAVIDTVAVHDALTMVDDPDVAFIDVRESVERQATGVISGSAHAARGFLEFHADPESPMHVPELGSGKRLVLYCASGGRSALAAKTLRDMGLENVASLAGGIAAWKEAGGPLE